MFYFREQELLTLQNFCSNVSSKAMAVYGRRRTGKTEFITHYMDLHATDRILYYQCTSYDYNTCLKDFTGILKLYYSGDTILDSLQTFRDVFTYISRDRKIDLIVIDEFPFLCKKKKDTVTEFQWIIDHGLNGIKLILMGSNRSFMKHQVSDRESPLYGRFDEILEIRPFTFDEVWQLFPDFDDAVQVYGETGGVAQYVMFFKNYPSVDKAVRHLYFNRNGRLFQESANYLLQEFKDPTVYANILRAIGSSEKDSGQIASKCGLESRAVFAYLKKLEELEIIGVAANPLSSKDRGARYRIIDRLLRFHFTFVEPNISMIAAVGERCADYILKNQLNEYLGFVYEEIIQEKCFSYALTGKIPFMPQTVGKWWGNVMDQGRWHESEVDVIAFDTSHIIIGECKYREKKIGLKELELLKGKSRYIPVQNRTVYYLLASRAGFTNDLPETSDVILIEKA